MISGSSPCWTAIENVIAASRAFVSALELLLWLLRNSSPIRPSLNRLSREKQAAVYQNPVARLSRFRPAVGTSSNSHPESRFAR